MCCRVPAALHCLPTLRVTISYNVVLVSVLCCCDADTMKRLIQAGLNLNFYPAQFVEQSAEAAAEVGPYSTQR
jgi:hypothetical protein